MTQDPKSSPPVQRPVSSLKATVAYATPLQISPAPSPLDTTTPSPLSTSSPLDTTTPSPLQRPPLSAAALFGTISDDLRLSPQATSYPPLFAKEPIESIEHAESIGQAESIERSESVGYSNLIGHAEPIGNAESVKPLSLGFSTSFDDDSVSDLFEQLLLTETTMPVVAETTDFPPPQQPIPAHRSHPRTLPMRNHRFATRLREQRLRPRVLQPCLRMRLRRQMGRLQPCLRMRLRRQMGRSLRQMAAFSPPHRLCARQLRGFTVWAFVLLQVSSNRSANRLFAPPFFRACRNLQTPQRLNW